MQAAPTCSSVSFFVIKLCLLVMLVFVECYEVRYPINLLFYSWFLLLSRWSDLHLLVRFSFHILQAGPKNMIFTDCCFGQIYSDITVMTILIVYPWKYFTSMVYLCVLFHKMQVSNDWITKLFCSLCQVW